VTPTCCLMFICLWLFLFPSCLPGDFFFILDYNDFLHGQVNVSISPRDNYTLEVALRCLAVRGDGLGVHEANDGGLLATVMSAGFKGTIYCYLLLVFITLCVQLALNLFSRRTQPVSNWSHNGDIQA